MVTIQLFGSTGIANDVWLKLLKISRSEQKFIYEIVGEYGGDYNYKNITFEDEEKASFFVLKFS